MTTFIIKLPDDESQRLRDRAADIGLTPEEFLEAGIKRWLASPKGDFIEAAEYVLRKNAELYRRLA